MWTIFWICAVVGALWIWSCWHECRELSVAVAFERNPWMAGVGSIALLYCMFDLAEVTITATWLAPTMALYKKCTEIDNKYMMDILRLDNPPQMLEQEEAQSNDCHQRLGVIGRIGVAIMTHGHDQ